MVKQVTILGIRFIDGTPAEVVAAGLNGGLVVVPSAPVLVEMERNVSLRAALLGADLAITDSGLMVLLWRAFRGERLTRVSGLEYLKCLLRADLLRERGPICWVMPNALARDRLIAWSQEQPVTVTADDCYLAPQYASGDIRDDALLAWVETRQPGHLVLAIGGGVQERLGLYLRDNLAFRLGIHCIGAAIGFLTGDQVGIPRWADRLYLGWLFRALSNPRLFVPRYWKAKRLVGLMWRYGAILPPLRAPRS